LHCQNDDNKYEFFQKFNNVATLEKKNKEISNRINQEYFFYNPAYRSLLEKRSQIVKKYQRVNTAVLKEDLEKHFMQSKTIRREKMKKEIEAIGAFLPSLSYQIKYKKRKRKSKSMKNRQWDMFNDVPSKF
jgi:hypothetical protein